MIKDIAEKGGACMAPPFPYVSGRQDGVNTGFDCVKVRFDSEKVRNHALKPHSQRDKVKKIRKGGLRNGERGTEI